MSNFSAKWRTIPGASSGRIRRSIFEYGSPIWEVMNDGFYGFSSVDYDWRDANDATKITKWLMAASAPNESEFFVDPDLHELNIKLDESVSTAEFFSNLRETFVIKETATWGVSQALCELRPQEYETRAPGIKPQQGLALRCQEDNNRRRHIVAWYDVVIGNPHTINAGVWSVNPDGSSFLNRQANKTMSLQVSLTATAGERTDGIVTVSGLSAPSLQPDDWVNVIWTKIVATGVAMTRSGNVVTATGLPVGHGIPADGMITVDLGSPSSFNITEVEITGAPDATTLTWAQTAANESGTGRIRDKSNDRRPARVIEIVDATTFRYEDLGQNRDQPAVTGAADMAILATSPATVNRIFPYYMHVKVQGSIFYVRCWNRNQSVPPFGDPDRSIVTDLDFPTTVLTVTAASRSAGIATLTVTETAIVEKLLVGQRIDVNLADNTYDTTTGTITGVDVGASQIQLPDSSADDAVGSTGTATVYGGSTAASINDNPTPTGSGAIGVVAAHEGFNARAACRYGAVYGDNQFNSDIVATVFPDLEPAVELEVANSITEPPPVTGTVAVTQADQSAAASGTATGPVTGTAAVTQAAQTSAASGQLGYSGTSATTQANQTSTASGQLGYSGSSAATQANQQAAAAGQLGYSGTAAAAQAAQTSSASGQLGYMGSAAASQAAQTCTASGKLGYSGTLAFTQAAQTSSASGTVTSAGIAGNAAVTQADQTAAGVAQLGYSGTASAVQANQVAAATGTFTTTVTGTLAVVQANQIAAASGTAFAPSGAPTISATYIVPADPRATVVTPESRTLVT